MTNKTESSSSVHRRKSVSKRPLVHSDGDDDPPVPLATHRTKRPRTVDTDTSPSLISDGDEDMDVDVDSLNAGDALSEDSHKGRVNTSKKRKRAPSTVVTKKKSHVVYSDNEESNSHFERDSEEDDLSDAAIPLPDASDDEFEIDTPPRRGTAKVKAGAGKGKAGKAKPSQLKGAKAKGPKDKDRDREIYMKDERKLTVPPSTTSRASSAAAQSQPSDLFASEDPPPSSTVDSIADASQIANDPLSQAISKKRKLPPIKKTKSAIAPTGTPTPATTSQKVPPPLPPPPPPPVQQLAKPSLPTSEQRKQALTGVRDIDLGDSKIYAELFKGAGGTTPRSGLKNAEERRKELDKMKDEARARRAEEAKCTFDLQSQADKIARFEQRLRTENSTVLHPNFLAAKMRDEWELERRNRRAGCKEEGEA